MTSPNSAESESSDAAPDRRLLLVHAHPDDESIGTGITMAKYLAEGAQVTLVTCTLGEEGEVLVGDLEHLAAEREDRLGPYRITELHNAMAALGVTDYLRLGGDNRSRDSGMKWDADGGGAVPRDEHREGTFWTTDLLTSADELVLLIRDRKPQVLITYDEVGAYGHPDHIQAHRVAMYAYLLAAVPSYKSDLGPAWSIPRVLWTANSETRMREGIRRLRAAGDTETWAGVDPDVAGSLPMTVPDEAIDAEITDTSQVDKKMAALRAYPTQISADSWFFSATDTVGDFWATEHFRFAAGEPFPDGEKWATDLFSGL